MNGSYPVTLRQASKESPEQMERWLRPSTEWCEVARDFTPKRRGDRETDGTVALIANNMALHAFRCLWSWNREEKITELVVVEFAPTK